MMSIRKVYDVVVPGSVVGWAVKEEHSQEPSSTHQTKDPVAARATELAKAHTFVIALP